MKGHNQCQLTNANENYVLAFNNKKAVTRHSLDNNKHTLLDTLIRLITVNYTN